MKKFNTTYRNARHHAKQRRILDRLTEVFHNECRLDFGLGFDFDAIGKLQSLGYELTEMPVKKACLEIHTACLIEHTDRLSKAA